MADLTDMAGGLVGLVLTAGIVQKVTNSVFPKQRVPKVRRSNVLKRKPRTGKFGNVGY